ncbi:HNH endonuclease [Bradyrhizobium sp. UFLA05-112]
MTFAIAPTDLDWFDRIRTGPIDRIVNFWTPTPWNVKGLQAGQRLYFMLKAPTRKIGGYGHFVQYRDATAKEAWRLYGPNNGTDSENELVRKIQLFAAKRSKAFTPTSDPVIGCIELSEVITLDDAAFVTPESCGHSFPREVVKLKYFSDPDGIAASIDKPVPSVPPFVLVVGDPTRKPVRRKERKGQSLFRREILRNYGNKCCISGDSVEALLEAAHIQPYINELSNHAQNGICLRVDLHRLFDAGLLTVNGDFEIVVSAKLKGTTYAGLKGKIQLPANPQHEPSKEAIKNRNTVEFRA